MKSRVKCSIYCKRVVHCFNSYTYKEVKHGLYRDAPIQNYRLNQGIYENRLEKADSNFHYVGFQICLYFDMRNLFF